MSPYPLFPALELLIYSSVAIFLSMNRLTGSLAYEFSFFLAAVATLTQSLAGAWRFNRIQKARPILSMDRLRAILASQLSLLPPLLISLFTTPLHPVCRWDVGFYWFILHPMVSSYFGIAAAIWATRPQRSSGRALFWATVPTLLFSLLTVRDLAFDPPLHFFHPAFGYFAGPIYDEWIPITLTLILFRAWTLLLATAILASTRWRPLLLTLALAPLFFRQEIGWFASHTTIQERLGSTLVQRSIRLHFSAKKLSHAEAFSLLHALLSDTEKIANALHLDPQKIRPIDVYLYPSVDLKKKWTGTRYTAIGNPMQRSLHLLDHNPESSLLIHELTHVIAAPLGIPGIGITYRTGLLEGLATAVEGGRGELSVHEWAAAMQKLDLLPNMEETIDPSGFFSASASRAYIASGSFCRWLISMYGIVPFKTIYRGGSFELIYGEALSTLVQRWESFLRTVRLPPKAIALARKEFKEKPIFERKCPHDIADALEQGVRCLARGETKEADHQFARAMDWSEGEASDQIQHLKKSF